jgi:uncharacterized membrane protein
MTKFTGLIAIVSSTLALSACTDMDGTMNRPANGAIIGGLTGVAIGNAVGDSKDARLIGGVVGAVIGSSIGAQLDAQEDELNRSLAGSGALCAQPVVIGSRADIVRVSDNPHG